ncbi:MAG: HEAT repeat domain-containing protein [Alphaproteobacteria bacterium]|nr:HEAT repeat domain-containing protein [Alphaproteobacteria bacterium]
MIFHFKKVKCRRNRNKRIRKRVSVDISKPDKSGCFMKGYSGNAGGRPKDEHNIAALARSYSTEAIETLVDLMRNARDDRVRGTAAQALLDRGFGKPKVEIQNTNTDFGDALEQVRIRLLGLSHSGHNDG